MQCFATDDTVRAKPGPVPSDNIISVRKRACLVLLPQNRTWFSPYCIFVAKHCIYLTSWTHSASLCPLSPMKKCLIWILWPLGRSLWVGRFLVMCLAWVAGIPNHITGITVNLSVTSNYSFNSLGSVSCRVFEPILVSFTVWLTRVAYILQVGP